MIDVFMTNVPGGRTAGEAWEAYRRLVLEDEQVKSTVVEMSERPNTRAMLEESRRVWHDRGFDEAPFDFMFAGAGQGAASCAR